MKKLILFLIVSMTMVSMSYSQNTEKKQIPDSSELTMMKVYSDVKGVLVGLSSSLKVGAEHVYGVLVKQQIVVSITMTLLIVLFIVIFFVLLNVFNKNYKRLSDENDTWYNDSFDEHVGVMIPFIGSIVIFLLIIILLCVNLSDIVTGFINPEYGAIMEILRKI